MQEFWIRLGSVKDVQDFVDNAATRPYPVVVRDSHNKISADSFMELFCLDFTQPLRVVANCSYEQVQDLIRDLDRLVVRD
ncbi:MAG: hypothetical protein IJB59_13655 [Oscillospiraceae bacterium]|nr:hypothetical protein [Oscillospiraceae bacterium]